MGLLDMLKKTAQDALRDTGRDLTNKAKASAREAGKDLANKAAKQMNTKTETFTFAAIPQTVEEMKALPEASLDTPFKTAALTVCALSVCGENREAGYALLDFLKGPQPLNPSEKQFLNNCFMDGKKYIPCSYFKGATPDNDYKPAEYTVSIFTNPYSYDQESEGYVVLWLTSGGADSPRQVKLRKKGAQWFLWEQFLLADIRKPKSEDPWA